MVRMVRRKQEVIEMVWKGEPRRHSLAKKGVKTVIDKDKRLAVNNYVARGVKYIGTVPSMHGCMDRSYDTYEFEDEDGNDIEVVVFSDPDFDSISDQISMEKLSEKQAEKLAEKEESEFYKNGEIHVIWDGGLSFTGTEKEFKNRYPDLAEYIL